MFVMDLFMRSGFYREKLSLANLMKSELKYA